MSICVEGCLFRAIGYKVVCPEVPIRLGPSHAAVRAHAGRPVSGANYVRAATPSVPDARSGDVCTADEPLRLEEVWSGYSARAERAGDRGGSASPEALDLIEARFAKRAQLYLKREVAILV